MEYKLTDRTINVEELYRTDFSTLDDFWSEGADDVSVKDNALIIKTTLERGNDNQYISSVFCKQQFQGPLIAEYNVRSIHADCHRNYNMFIHTKMRDGRDLFETREERTGDYGEYHIMDNYLFTFLPSPEENPDGTVKARYRMRRDPGFELRKEIHSYACETFRWYNFKYLVDPDKGEVRIYVDDVPEESYAWIDAEPLTEGYTGFRTFCSHLEIKDFAVYGILGRG